MENIHESVQDYYGKELQHTNDLKTNACCTITDIPDYIKKGLSNVHDEVLAKYYGCGIAIPHQIQAAKILDLGSGSGRDCYLLSQLVGQEGEVIGVDMTDEQLNVANKHLDYHKDKFNFSKNNVQFLKGNIEELEKLNLKNNYFDIIVSNCVINLAKNKLSVLKSSYDLLKEGGEMYFSDIYVDRRIPKHLQNDPVLYGECLSGSLYWNDFIDLSKEVGFNDPRVVEVKPVTIENAKIQKQLQGYNFYSVTVRLFKIPKLEYRCEDFGQAVIYKGNIKNSEKFFDLDEHHRFFKGKVKEVCGNTYRMLNDTRFSNSFDFIGNWDTHYGIFTGCGGDMPFSESAASPNTSTDIGCC